MGLNRQPRPKREGGPGGRGGGTRGGANAQFHQRRKDFFTKPRTGKESGMTTGSRDMIIDVLSHIATGGESEVSTKHFDPAASKATFTFKKNAQLSPTELLQLYFERNGCPPDVTTQFLAEIDQTPAMPTGYINLVELQRDHLPFLRRGMWDIFAMMVWNHEFLVDTGTAATAESGEQRKHQLAEEEDEDDNDESVVEMRNAVREDEQNMLEMMFGDDGLFIDQTITSGDPTTGDDDEECEYHYVRVETKDRVEVIVTIKLLPHYPHDPPLVQIRSSAKPLPPQTHRALYDAAVDAIAVQKGMPCLASVVTACREALTQHASIQPELDVERKAAEAERKKRLMSAKAKGEDNDARRREFVNALASSGPSKTTTGDSTKQAAGTSIAAADKEESASSPAAVAKNLPEIVEFEAVEAEETKATRDKFLRNNTAQSEKLLADWGRLQKQGKLMPRRRELPAFQLKQTICGALDSSSVIVVSGETGSGKTTQVPQFVLENEIEQKRGSACNIICTQPRRLAATAVALRVADERDEEIGGTVGYSIRLENKFSARTKLMYCTTGILLRKLQMDPFIGDVSHVIVDEIHERGVDTDFLLIILRDLLQKRPKDLKVVLMSATMDAELFSNYFNGAPCLHIPGRTFPVQRFFLEDIVEMTGYYIDDSSDFAAAATDAREVRMRNKNKGRHLSEIDVAVDEMKDEMKLEITAKEIAQERGTAKEGAMATAEEKEGERGGGDGRPIVSQRSLMTLARMNLDTINYELIEQLVQYIDQTYRFEGAILIFMPGLAEIQRCIDEMKANRHLNSRCVFYNLHSSLGSSEQTAVFNRPPRGKRKVVVGTNIMETSITIDDAVFVIDCGKFKENRYDAKRSMSQLITCWIAKSNASQRQGRAGRVREGFCFRLYTEQQYNKLRDHQVCEMHRVPLESLVLQITLLNLGDEMDYLSKALSPPEERAVKASVSVLKSLGALTNEKRLTSLGYHLASLPLDVRIGKMIIHGALLRCLDPVLTIAACLSIKSPFLSSPEDQGEIEGVRRGFSGDFRSDQLAAWFAYLKWRSTQQNKGNKAAKDFIWDAFLSSNALSQIQATKRQYERYLCESGFISESTSAVSRRGTGYTHFAFDPHVTLEGITFESGGGFYNENSMRPKCILACLMAGLYPNVARVVKKPKFNKVVGVDGTELIVHPSSVNAKHQFEQPFLIYVDKVKTSQTFLRETSMVSPYILLLFGGPVQFLENYSEIAIGNFVSLQCHREDGILLSKLREQLDSTLRSKINDPSTKWESTSTHIVSAIVKLLTDEGTGSSSLAVIDRSTRAGLTKNYLPPPPPEATAGGTAGGSRGEASPTAPGAAAPEKKQKYYTSRECFNCGQVGHLSRDCKQQKRLAHYQGGPTVKCFICGLKTHHPPQCPLAKQPKPPKE